MIWSTEPDNEYSVPILLAASHSGNEILWHTAKQKPVKGRTPAELKIAYPKLVVFIKERTRRLIDLSDCQIIENHRICQTINSTLLKRMLAVKIDWSRK